MATFGKIGARPLLLKNTGEYAEEQMYKELFLGTARRTITSISTDELTSVGAYAFAYCSSLHGINLPNVASIGNNAFWYCTNLGDLVFPNVTTVSADAFCRTTVKGHLIDFPELTTCSGRGTFRDSQFYGGTINIPKLTTIAGSMFYQFLQRNNNNQIPTYINADSATYITDGAFYNCTGLRRLYAPRVTSLSNDSNLFINAGRRYCGENRNVAADECAIILGSKELDTGMTMDTLMEYSNFPFRVYVNEYSPTWHCKDGTVTYDTTTSTWVQTPYT